jgi:hypothetical protein
MSRQEMNVFPDVEEIKIEEEYTYDALKKKQPPVRMTFDIDPQLAKLLKKISTKQGHGFKKVFINEAIKNELTKFVSN